MFKKFLSRNLAASRGVPDEIEDDMGGHIAVLQQNMDNLRVLLSGEKSYRKNKHHHPKDSTQNIITGIENVLKIRRQIER